MTCPVRFVLGPITAALLDAKVSEGGQGPGVSVTLTGKVVDPVGLQLVELLTEPGAKSTHSVYTGVLEQAYFDWDPWRHLSGWWVFTDAVAGQDYPMGRLAGTRDVTITGVNLGQRALAVASRSTPVANDFGVVGKGITVAPFYDEFSDGSGAWVVPPGTVFADVPTLSTVREYDSGPMTSYGANTEPLVTVTPPLGRYMSIGIG